MAARCVTKVNFNPLKECELRTNSYFSDKICLLLVYHSHTLTTSPTHHATAPTKK